MAYRYGPEGYGLGTSDYPKSPRESNLRTRESTLELILAGMPMPIIENGQTDVQATNKARIDWASKYLLPVYERNKVVEYRVVEIDEGGFIKISYTTDRPKSLQAFSTDEAITVKHALAIFGLTRQQLLGMISQGRVRRRGVKGPPSKIYLSDLGGLFSV